MNSQLHCVIHDLYFTNYTDFYNHLDLHTDTSSDDDNNTDDITNAFTDFDDRTLSDLINDGNHHKILSRF